MRRLVRVVRLEGVDRDGLVVSAPGQPVRHTAVAPRADRAAPSARRSREAVDYRGSAAENGRS